MTEAACYLHVALPCDTSFEAPVCTQRDLSKLFSKEASIRPYVLCVKADAFHTVLLIYAGLSGVCVSIHRVLCMLGKSRMCFLGKRSSGGADEQHQRFPLQVADSNPCSAANSCMWGVSIGATLSRGRQDKQTLQLYPCFKLHL